MNCGGCGAELDRPGDYCLRCETANCDAVVVVFAPDRATLTMLSFDDADEGDAGGHGGGRRDDAGATVLGETTVTATPETGERTRPAYLRNFAGRVADELRRKRPETVYAAGERAPLRETRAQVHYEFYRVPDDDPVGSVIERRDEPSLEVVEKPPDEKLGGSHTTLIGGRTGRAVIGVVAAHPHVKKIIPGPIDAGGQGSQSGLRAKATRADKHGNVRLLLRDGSSVQENRVVTTAGDRETGERVRAGLNDALDEEGLS
ncbi:DUF2103 domain-containing protein [Candidatus Halobonum tyrrellensis]|uniref:Metal-binding protein n=1 Tax=Candidatus Halobonum tyrrellensis G22 TaxID=1324957 RepID=V4HG41_9EURY|nr:DUF2103 domain-containing protein [Candidatus Halobonum tyrrellensis]ESP89685.1 hypothetical protein K933_02806 [Candidatus Halobonum tyrrellensis G22]